MIHTVLDANAELGNLRFIVHTSDFANLLKQQVTVTAAPRRCNTRAAPIGSTASRCDHLAATEGKVALLDMSKVNSSIRQPPRPG